MLLNRERANRIMDREGLDALVAVAPINVYYLSDYWGALMRMRRSFYNYAVLTRDESKPSALIVTGVEHLRFFHNPAATWMENRMPYVHPIYQDRRDFDPDVEDPEAIEYGMKWPISHDTLSPRDKEYLAYMEAHRGKASVNALYALKKGLQEAGLESARIGSDDPRIGPWLHEIGLPGVMISEATTLFREIRMVKTPREIELMRQVARMNEEALEAVIDSLRVGMPRTELERIYNVEIARRGGRGLYLATGQHGTNNNLGGVLETETITFDGLCEYQNYHGDLGRVAVCGSPRPDVVERVKALEIGCETLLKTIRPGITANEVTSTVIEAVRKGGFEGFFFATPHSIGLEHSDHMIPIGPTLPGGNGEFVFEENMIFSLDMPYYEIGWGNLHVEDQILVTANGAEPLTNCDVSLRVRPATPYGAAA
ncbi:M24 family metallopeptidase [Novosphingobium sp. PP1Y]|uniref:M24 family metallopeptidase n=1 Tax=Novosphingobium sp. PP1Y TaxID=702113 RepID=UPI00020EED51|nr:M24 family metallopeptidase [Novosphingobium sp. PP1Y]CCA92873.1 peptidase M24 [Novosphingobium sp. PP1Y]